jgi:hypothetical protein
MLKTSFLEVFAQAKATVFSGYLSLRTTLASTNLKTSALVIN